jgi:hypothetical protein
MIGLVVMKTSSAFRYLEEQNSQMANIHHLVELLGHIA